MRLNLKSVETMLRRFKNLLFGKSEKPVDACASAEASKKLNVSSKEENPMIKVGDKVLVLAKVTQVVEDEDGVHFVVSPDKKKSYQTMRIEKEDIQSCLRTD